MVENVRNVLVLRLFSVTVSTSGREDETGSRWVASFDFLLPRADPWEKRRKSVMVSNFLRLAIFIHRGRG